jgi:hypothetical protein
MVLRCHGADEGTFVTAGRVQPLVDAAAASAAGGGGAGAGMIQVISAFDVPKILYDPIRKSFYRAPAPTSLLGTAQARHAPRTCPNGFRALRRRGLGLSVLHGAGPC